MRVGKVRHTINITINNIHPVSFRGTGGTAGETIGHSPVNPGHIIARLITNNYIDMAVKAQQVNFFM